MRARSWVEFAGKARLSIVDEMPPLPIPFDGEDEAKRKI